MELADILIRADHTIQQATSRYKKAARPSQDLTRLVSINDACLKATGLLQLYPDLLPSEHIDHFRELLTETFSTVEALSIVKYPDLKRRVSIPRYRKISEKFETLESLWSTELQFLESLVASRTPLAQPKSVAAETEPIKLAVQNLSEYKEEAREWVFKLKPRQKQLLKKAIFEPGKNGLITLPLKKTPDQLHEESEIELLEFDTLDAQYTRQSISVTHGDSSTIESASLTSNGFLRLHLIVCDVQSRSIRPSNISFSEESFVNIMADFQLPGEFLHVLFTGTPILLRREDSEGRNWSCVMRTPLSNSENWTMALTYDDVSRTTFAIVHGFQKEELGRLLLEMDEFKTSSIHPLLLPGLLCRMLIVADSKEVKRLGTDLFGVENKTIWHGHWKLGKDEGLSQSQDAEQEFENLTRTLNRITARLAFHEMRLNANFVLISNLRSLMVKSLERWCKGMRSEERQVLTSSLDQLLSNLQAERESLLLEITCNQKIADGQLQIVYSLIAQHDNKENLRMATLSTQIAAITKEDSFAMRTIAVMTITFLPATALSSLFSMGMFDWRAHGGDTVVSSRFWIYWAIAVPLTLSVLGLWLIYVRRHKKNNGESLSENLEGLSITHKRQYSADRRRKGLRAYVSGMREKTARPKDDESL